MVKYMCSIFDVQAQAWLVPMFFQGKGQAVRAFADAVNDGKSEFYKHPEDYSLFLLGMFDERTGEIDVVGAPEALAIGVNVRDDYIPDMSGDGVTVDTLREALTVEKEA